MDDEGDGDGADLLCVMGNEVFSRFRVTQGS